MRHSMRDGFRYAVSAEQLDAYARMTTRQRLEWVDAARTLTLKLRTPETAIRHERRGAARFRILARLSTNPNLPTARR